MGDTDDDLFAEQRGQRAHAKIDLTLRTDLELHPAVLRNPLLGNIQARNHLDAGGQLVLDDRGRACDLAQFAIDAKAHAVLMFVGLEVDVRRAHAEGVEQHLVQEAHDRRIFDFGRRGIVGLARSVRGHLVELELGADDVVDGFGRAHGGRFDHARELVVLGNDPVHAHLRRKLDLFGGLLIGRVSCCDNETVVALAEDDHPVGRAQLGVEKVLRQPLRVDGVQVQQGGAEGAGQRVSQVGGRHGAGACELSNEAAAAAERLLIDVLGDLGRQLSGRDQRTREPWKGDRRAFFDKGFGSGHSTGKKREDLLHDHR
ncbi:hypothetical protein L963_1607 [Leuconostoc mesenteroides subsp. cremoris T26]|nr:hypothetical protein L963_1607 [Leuconostoc mesenteroides subsp. cremoris T26]